EVLFFGGLFLGYAAYRFAYPADFRAAGEHTLLLAGAVNTAVLLVSSFTMALAVRAAELHRRKALTGLLCATALLGLLFLGIKAVEYATEIREGLLPGASFHPPGPVAGPALDHQRIFFSFYFTMTGLHAVHVTIGIALLLGYAWRAWRSKAPARLTTGVDLLGLYWHFVDIVWVFLFPLIYLIGRHR
ncbi:MAG TPA: cytochrome c oxidase subunit 3, partial [Chthoniobacteraceae bacterium]|nr:cytochrome c oxidase subunit 3 [Chthoniobacteraceae bacterium]